MNVQNNLIQELTLYKFEEGHNTAETAKNICCVKVEGALDHSKQMIQENFAPVTRISSINQD